MNNIHIYTVITLHPLVDHDESKNSCSSSSFAGAHNDDDELPYNKGTLRRPAKQEAISSRSITSYSSTIVVAIIQY
jgi:hypothetical protein